MKSEAVMRRVGHITIASTAVIRGEVACGADVNIWYGAVVRGDVAPITLGEHVNIQDGAVVHCDFERPNLLEPGVVVGHLALVHGVRVGADTLVGMGAKLLGETVIGEECVIAAGAVVAPGTVVPPRSVVMGVPGRVVRTATADEIARTKAINKRYRELAARYVNGDIARPFGG